MKHRILILFAHPAIRQSQVNRYLIGAVKGLENISVVDLYELYPDFHIDVDTERARLSEFDVLIVQHPLIWFGCPAILKEWIDRVLEFGLDNCRCNHVLKDKYWLSVITCNTHVEGDQWHNKGLTDSFKPFEHIADYCQMNFIKPYVIYRANENSPEEIRKRAEHYKQFLMDIRDLGVEQAQHRALT